MKFSEYKINSWHSILYRSTYGANSLPYNICTYFWSLLFAILIAPISWIGHGINLIRRKFECKAGYWAIHFIPVMLIGWAIAWEKTDPFNFWKSYGFGLLVLLVVAIIIAALIGLAFLKQEFEEWLDKIRDDRPKKIKIKKPNPLIEGFKAFKGKYCTKIYWV